MNPTSRTDSDRVEFLGEARVQIFTSVPVAGHRRRTPKEILDWMIRRRAYYGSPLPDGYVAPPGIDIDELLKQLPPLPPNRSDGGA